MACAAVTLVRSREDNNGRETLAYLAVSPGRCPRLAILSFIHIILLELVQWNVMYTVRFKRVTVRNTLDCKHPSHLNTIKLDAIRLGI